MRQKPRGVRVSLARMMARLVRRTAYYCAYNPRRGGRERSSSLSSPSSSAGIWWYSRAWASTACASRSLKVAVIGAGGKTGTHYTRIQTHTTLVRIFSVNTRALQHCRERSQPHKGRFCAAFFDSSIDSNVHLSEFLLYRCDTSSLHCNKQPGYG